MDAFLRDLKHSARMLLRAPSFTIAAIAALALGIATNVAIFSVVDTVLLKPFAYSDPGRIVMFQNTYRQGIRSGSAAPAEFNWWRQHNDAFQYISAYGLQRRQFDRRFLPGTDSDDAQSARISSSCAAQSRSSGAHSRPRTTCRTLQRPLCSITRFGSGISAAISRLIGRRIALNGDRYEIIGVMGPDLQGGQIAERSLLSGDIEIYEPPDVYLPFQLDPNSNDRGHYFNVAGR